MSRRTKATPTKVVSLQERFRLASDQVFRDLLPGWKEFISTDAKAANWIVDWEVKIRQAIARDEENRFDAALATWRRAWERVNELLADAYRASHPDSATWDLRFLKWMTGIIYIRFASPMGEFYVVPRRAPVELEGKRWYTADDVIAMLHPTVTKAIQEFGALPAKDDFAETIPFGEKYLTVDFTGETPSIKYRVS